MLFFFHHSFLKGVLLSGEVTGMQHRLQRNNTTVITTTVEAINNRFGSLINEDSEDYSAVNCMKIFHHDTWPENTNELVDYGNDQLEALIENFLPVLTRHVAVKYHGFDGLPDYETDE